MVHRYFRSIFAYLWNNISYHGQKLQVEKQDIYDLQIWIQLDKFEQYYGICWKIGHPIKNFSKERALIVFPGHHSIKVV